MGRLLIHEKQMQPRHYSETEDLHGLIDLERERVLVGKIDKVFLP